MTQNDALSATINGELSWYRDVAADPVTGVVIESVRCEKDGLQYIVAVSNSMLTISKGVDILVQEVASGDFIAAANDSVEARDPSVEEITLPNP